MATSSVLAVGDVFLDREYPKQAFEHVQEVFETADLVLGNHEGPLSQAGEPRLFYPWLSVMNSTPEMVEGLDAAGFDILSLANNQTMNYGPESLLDSLELLADRDIAVAGAGEDKEAAERPVTQIINDERVGVLAFEATRWDWKDMQALPDQPGLNLVQTSQWYPEPYVSQYDLEKLETLVANAAETHDTLLVLAHFGITGDYQLATYQKALARRVIDSGADAVIGAHSHTLQAVEVYQEAPIFYGLGNFVFDTPDIWGVNWMPSETAVAQLELDDGVVGAELYPAVYDSGPRNKPKLLSPGTEDYADVEALLMRLSETEGTPLESIDDHIRVPL